MSDIPVQLPVMQLDPGHGWGHAFRALHPRAAAFTGAFVECPQRPWQRACHAESHTRSCHRLARRPLTPIMCCADEQSATDGQPVAHSLHPLLVEQTFLVRP